MGKHTSQKKFEQDLEATCIAVSGELGLVGTFEKSSPHNHFRVCLPDLSVVKITLPATPRSNVACLLSVQARIRRSIITNLESRGLI